MAKQNNQYLIDIYIDEPFEFFNTLEASRSLTGAAFKVYVYLTMMGTQYDFKYSPKKLVEELGVSLSSVHNAFTELVAKKFLKERYENHYIFNSTKI